MLNCFRRVWLFATLQTVARQPPLSMGLSGQEYRSGLPYPTPGDLPDPGIEPTSLASPAFAGGFFTASAASAAPREEFVAAPRRREYRARTTRGSIRVGQQAEGQEECVGQLPHCGLRREGHSRQVRGCPSGSAPGHGGDGSGPGPRSDRGGRERRALDRPPDAWKACWRPPREAVPPPSGRPQSTRNRNKTWLVHCPGLCWASSVCPALPWDLWILRKRIHMPFIHPEWVLLSFEAVGINSHRGSSDSRTGISKTVQYEYYRSVLLKLNKLCIPFKEKYFPQIPSVDKLYFIIILFYMKYTAKAICTTYN